MMYNKRLSSIHDKQGLMDHTVKINPNQSVLTLIPLDKARKYWPIGMN